MLVYEPDQNLVNSVNAIRSLIKASIEKQINDNLTEKYGLTYCDKFKLANGDIYEVPSFQELLELVEMNFNKLICIHLIHRPISECGKRGNLVSLNVTCPIAKI